MGTIYRPKRGRFVIRESSATLLAKPISRRPTCYPPTTLQDFDSLGPSNSGGCKAQDVIILSSFPIYLEQGPALRFDALPNVSCKNIFSPFEEMKGNFCEVIAVNICTLLFIFFPRFLWHHQAVFGDMMATYLIRIFFVISAIMPLGSLIIIDFH